MLDLKLLTIREIFPIIVVLLQESSNAGLDNSHKTNYEQIFNSTFSTQLSFVNKPLRVNKIVIKSFAILLARIDVKFYTYLATHG